MKNFFLGFLAVITCFSQNSFPQSLPERDFQFWFDTQVTFPIIKKKEKNNREVEKLSFFILGNLRGGRNLSHFIDERIGAGLDIFVNSYFTISPSYFYRAGQPSAGSKEYEHRLRLDGSFEKKWTHFSIKDRNRIEYRRKHSRPDSVRYRNKIQLKMPIKSDGQEILAPFVAIEPFYDFREKAWTRNEFSAGFSKKFTSAASADFFYLLQSNRGNNFKTVNTVGISLKFKVD